jgi:hypothetical protein
VPKYLFLDWSGDVGFKFGRGSSEYLVLALASSTDYGRVRKNLASLRKELGLSPLFEFHYRQTPPRLGEVFFDALIGLPFSAEILVAYKLSLSPSFVRMKEAEIYGHFVSDLILRVDQTIIEQALLLVDAQRSDMVLVRGIRVAVSHALEEAEVVYGLRKVKARPAKEEDGIQIADMIAGAIVDRLRGKRDYLAELEKHLRVWHYEPK